MRVSLLIGSVLALALALAPPAGAQRGPGVEEAGTEERVAPIGLVLAPTAYTIPQGRWLFGAGAFSQSVVTGTTDRQYSLGLYNGITNNLYAGAFWTGVRRERTARDSIIESFFGGLAHYKFASEGSAIWEPSLAIGGDAYFGHGNGQTVYAVASKNLMGSVRPGALFLHVGGRWDRAENGGASEDALRPFAGANLMITDTISLNGEVRQRHFGERHNLWAAGAIIGIGGGYAISAGFEDPGSGKARLYAGLNILP